MSISLRRKYNAFQINSQVRRRDNFQNTQPINHLHKPLTTQALNSISPTTPSNHKDLRTHIYSRQSNKLVWSRSRKERKKERKEESNPSIIAGMNILHYGYTGNNFKLHHCIPRQHFMDACCTNKVFCLNKLIPFYFIRNNNNACHLINVLNFSNKLYFLELLDLVLTMLWYLNASFLGHCLTCCFDGLILSLRQQMLGYILGISRYE